MKNFKITRSILSQLLFVWLSFFLMVLITFYFVGNIVHSYLAKEAENTLSYTQSKIATDIREAETLLQTVSQSILIMIRRGDSSDVILEHMTEITDYMASDEMRVSGFNGIFGYFYVFASESKDGMFLDGSGWIPPDDYMPQDRPWYKEAVIAGGGIAATTPYTSFYPGALVVSYSRLIHDTIGVPLGVVSIDIRLDKMADYVVNTRLTEGGFGMLFNENLDIIATPTKENLGKHITELPDRGISEVVDRMKKGMDIFEHIVRDDSLDSNYILFTRQLENGWHIGILTPIDNYYQQVTNIRIFIAILGAFFAVALSLVLLQITRAKQKAFEESLEAKAASKAKGEFLATMSHEMRTPLNVIIGLSEIETQKPHTASLPEASRDNITQILRSGTTLLEIVNDILDISKIEAGRFELYPETYNTASMINDTIILCKVRIGSMPVNFVLEIDGSFPAKLHGDELRVKQILNNLLSNAIKYTVRGTVTLCVLCELIDSKTTAVRFSVKDTGIGIRKDDMGKLFSNYTQLDTGTRRKTEGTGLGLPIVKNLAEIMNGRITVTSEYGKGSCFTAEITQGIDDLQPIGEETAENLRSFKFVDEREDEEIEFIWLPEAKALIVDDLPANQRVIKGLLAPYGIKIDTAGSGKESIELIKNNSYDIIFMDHMMPEMDGVEAAAAIRAWEKETAVNNTIVAMTANAIRGVREYYLENGFDDYISKPVIPKNLHEIITKWIKVTPSPYPQRNHEQPNAEEQGERGNNGDFSLPQSLNSLMTEQCIDVLNHYFTAFKSSREIDAEYFAKFCAYVRSLDNEVIKTLQNNSFAPRSVLTSKEQTDKKVFNEMLPQLENALLSSDTKKANTILAGIGALDLTDSARELYIQLYDLLMEDKIKDALELTALKNKGAQK